MTWTLLSLTYFYCWFSSLSSIELRKTLGVFKMEHQHHLLNSVELADTGALFATQPTLPARPHAAPPMQPPPLLEYWAVAQVARE
jgi:hypothetical protein